MQNDYEQFLLNPEIRLLPVSANVLRQAAKIRASVSKIKTPDTIHAASGLLENSVLFLTNDIAFQSVPALPVLILQNVLSQP